VLPRTRFAPHSHPVAQIVVSGDEPASPVKLLQRTWQFPRRRTPSSIIDGPVDRPAHPEGHLITDRASAVDAAPTSPEESASRSVVPGGRLATWLRRILLASVLAATGYALYDRHSDISHTLHAVPWQSLVLSELAVVLGMCAGAMGWHTMVNDLGDPSAPVRPARSFQIVQVGLLGKYVPGSVWAYLLQMELGRKAGVPRPRVFAATLIQVGISIVASLMLGVAALPLVLKHSPEAAWLFLLLPVGLVALHPKILTWGTSRALVLLRRPPLPHPVRWRAMAITLGWALLSYSLFGAHLWLLANSQGGPGAGRLLVCTGAIAIGLTAGIFAFVLPSGLGVREAVLVAALSTGMPGSRALAFAVASRIMFTLADVATAGGAALTAYLRVRPEAEA
jgi:glycosyltransferase 2 family protein